MTKILFSLAILLFISACERTVDSNPNKEIAKANEQLAENEWTEVKAIYSKVLQIDPHNSDAALGLAKLALDEGQYQISLNYLQNILKSTPKHFEANLISGKIFLIQNKIQQALAVEATLIDISPDNIDTLLYRANFAILRKSDNEAYQFAEEILSISPYHPEATAIKAKKYFNEKKYDLAINILNKSLSDNENDINLNYLKITVLSKMGMHEKVESLYLSLLDNKPNEESIYHNLAKFYLLQNNKDQALEVLTRLANNTNISISDKLNSVALLNQYNLSGIAIRYLLNLQKIDSKNPLLTLALANQYSIIGEFEKAENEYQKIITQNTNDNSYEILSVVHSTYINYAKIKITQNETATAKELVNKALELSPTSLPALELRAQIFQLGNDFQAADSDFLEILRLQPDNTDIKIAYAANKFSMGNIEKSLSLFRRYTGENENNNALAANYLYHLIAAEEFQLASNFAATWLATNGDKPEILALYSETLINLEKYPLSLAIIGRYEDLVGKNSFSHFIKGVALTNLNQTETAIDEFKQSLASDPSNIQTSNALIEVYFKIDQLPTAIDFFNQQAVDKNPTALYSLAVVYKLDNQIQEAISTLDKLLNQHPESVIGYITLANLYYSNGNLNNALDTLLSGLSNNPNTASLHKEIALLQTKAKQYDVAIEHFKMAHELYPSDLITANNYISLMSDHQAGVEQLENLRPTVNSLKQLDTASINDTIGWFYYRIGEYTQAKSFIEKAIQKNGEEPVYHYHLGMVYKGLNKIDLAKESFSIAIASTQENTKVFQDSSAALKSL